jgi:hypothetical protein
MASREQQIAEPVASADPQQIYEMLVAMDAQLSAMHRLVRIAIAQFKQDPRPDPAGAKYETYDG